MIRKIVTILTIGGVLLLSGCSKKTSTVTCKVDGNEDAYYKLETKGDEITKYISFFHMDMTEDDTFFDQMVELSDANEKLYKKVDGVTFKATVKDKILEETMTVEITDKNIKKQIESGVFNAYIKNQDDTSLDLERVKTSIEADGFKCK